MVNRRTNLLTRRFSYFGTWESTWVGDNLIYSDLIYQDFKIISFLNGLFKKLSIPTGKFNMVRYLNSFVIIETDLYVIRPFWILYSHLDKNMESSFLYYFSRLLFNLPKLMLYANMNNYMKLDYVYSNSNLFFMYRYRDRIKELRLLLKQRSLFYEDMCLFLCNKSKVKVSDVTLDFFFFGAYNTYWKCVDFCLGDREEYWYYWRYYDSVACVRLFYRNTLQHRLRKIERINEATLKYYYKKMEYLNNWVVYSKRNPEVVKYVENFRKNYLAKNLIKISDAASRYFRSDYAKYYFGKKLNYLISLFITKRSKKLLVKYIGSGCNYRTFNSVEIRLICSVINRSFLFFLYRTFLFSHRFLSWSKNNKRLKKLLKMALILHKFFLFIHKKVFGVTYRFDSRNLEGSVGLFVYKVRKALGLFFSLHRNTMFYTGYINQLLLSLSVLGCCFIYVSSKKRRFYFFNNMLHLFPLFATPYIIRYFYNGFIFFNFCFYHEGLYNFHFSLFSSNVFSVSTNFVRLVNLFRIKNSYFNTRRLSFMLRNVFFIRCKYFYNHYYYVLCISLFNYLRYNNFKLFCSYFNIHKKTTNLNMVSIRNVKLMSRLTSIKNDLINKFSIIVMLLSKFLNVFFLNVRSLLWMRRIIIYGYYRSFFGVQNFNFLFWLLSQLRIRFFVSNNFFRWLWRGSRYYIKCFSGRRDLLVNFNRMRIKFDSFVRRKVLSHLLFINKIMYGFISLKLFSISFDRLIYNIEFVFSEYLRTTVLFLPNVYFEDVKRFFWRYGGLNILNVNRVILPFYGRGRSKSRMVKRVLKYKLIKKNNDLFRFLTRFNNLLVFRLFFKYNKKNLLRMFFRMLQYRNKVSYKKIRRFYSRIILFFIKYVKYVYMIFLKKKILYKSKNLSKLSFILGKYKRLSCDLVLNSDRIDDFILGDSKYYSINVSKLFILRSLRKVSEFKDSKLFSKYLGIHSKKKKRFFLWPIEVSDRRDKFEHSSYERFNNIYLTTRFPPMKDAKLLCDYIVYYLNLRVKLYRIFSNLKYWQDTEYRVINTLMHTGWVESELVYKKYPLCGIRILCSGSFKKGGRKHRHYYHLWIRKQRLTRKMPLQTIEMDVDYFSANTNVVTGTVGVKVWLCFSTISYRYRIRNCGYYV